MEQTQWESCCPGLCLVPQLVGAGGKLYPLYSCGARACLIPWHQSHGLECAATRCCIPVASLSCPPGLLLGLSWSGFDHCRPKDSQPHWQPLFPQAACGAGAAPKRSCAPTLGSPVWHLLLLQQRPCPGYFPPADIRLYLPLKAVRKVAEAAQVCP